MPHCPGCPHQNKHPGRERHQPFSEVTEEWWAREESITKGGGKIYSSVASTCLDIHLSSIRTESSVRLQVIPVVAWGERGTVHQHVDCLDLYTRSFLEAEPFESCDAGRAQKYEDMEEWFFSAIITLVNWSYHWYLATSALQRVCRLLRHKMTVTQEEKQTVFLNIVGSN